MRINGTLQNKIEPNKNNSSRGISYAQNLPNETNILKMQEIPSFAFKGSVICLAKNELLSRVKPPQALDKLPGELFATQLFNKYKNKMEDVFLNLCDDSYNKQNKVLSIFGENNKLIGDVTLDYSDKALGKTYLRLSNLQNHAKYCYQGVGSTLIQAAVEKSLLDKQFNGKLCLFAHNCMTAKYGDPFPFYNKMGFSIDERAGGFPSVSPYDPIIKTAKSMDLLHLFKEPMSPTGYAMTDDNLRLLYEKFAEKNELPKDTVNLNFSDHMYLHDDKVKTLWLPKIKENRIFKESNRIN